MLSCFKKCKWDIYEYKFGDNKMGEGSDPKSTRQHTINFRAIASSWYK